MHRYNVRLDACTIQYNVMPMIRIPTVAQYQVQVALSKVEITKW